MAFKQACGFVECNQKRILEKRGDGIGVLPRRFLVVWLLKQAPSSASSGEKIPQSMAAGLKRTFPAFKIALALADSAPAARRRECTSVSERPYPLSPDPYIRFRYSTAQHAYMLRLHWI